MLHCYFIQGQEEKDRTKLLEMRQSQEITINDLQSLRSKFDTLVIEKVRLILYSVLSVEIHFVFTMKTLKSFVLSMHSPAAFQRVLEQELQDVKQNLAVEIKQRKFIETDLLKLKKSAPEFDDNLVVIWHHLHPQIIVIFLLNFVICKGVSG